MSSNDALGIIKAQQAPCSRLYRRGFYVDIESQLLWPFNKRMLSEKEHSLPARLILFNLYLYFIIYGSRPSQGPIAHL